MTTPSNQNSSVERILAEFDDKFDGLWLDGMTDYATDRTFTKQETTDKIKDFIKTSCKEFALSVVGDNEKCMHYDEAPGICLCETLTQRNRVKDQIRSKINESYK